MALRLVLQGDQGEFRASPDQNMGPAGERLCGACLTPGRVKKRCMRAVVGGRPAQDLSRPTATAHTHVEETEEGEFLRRADHGKNPL